MIYFPNAKINLGLNIVSKRQDGYHNIETVFYPIKLKDALEVLPTKDMLSYVLHESGLMSNSKPEHNLVIQALNIIGEERELPNLDIHLLKTIPSGAGLGGGSADGAFMLRLLNEKFQLGFSKERLQQLAYRLGADCSFFINNRPAIATGIGNELEEVDINLDHLYLVVVKPNVSVSTKEAYSHITLQSVTQSLKEIISLPITEWKDKMHNDFEPYVFDKYPVVEDIKNELYNLDALYASMSGSGSAVYGFFKERPSLLNFSKHFVWTNY